MPINQRRTVLISTVGAIAALSAANLIAATGAQGTVEPREEKTETGIQLHELHLTRQQRRHLERKAAKARRAK